MAGTASLAPSSITGPSRATSSRSCRAWTSICGARRRKAHRPDRDQNRRAGSQFQLPRLADQALAETAVRFAANQHESRVLINPAGGDQDALGPQRDLAIAALPRERQAFGDQPLAESRAAPGRIDQQQP